MKRRLALTAGALVAALSFSSCSTFDHSDVAATVNGHELTRDQLDTLASTLVAQLQAGDAKVDAYRVVLTRWVQLVLVEGDAYASVPATADDMNNRFNAAVPLLDRTDADGEAFYAAGPSAVGVACLSAIQTADAATAAEALAAIDGGMTFADAAVQFNEDPAFQQSRGVVLGQDGSDCIGVDQLASGLVDTITALKVGEPTDIIPINDVFLIIVVRPWDEVLPASQLAIIERAPPAQVREGDVSIASRFGTWNADTFTVVGPAAG